jgi:hypothetical protein
MTFVEKQVQRVKEQEEKNKAIVDAIPEKYHHYIMYMEKATKISNKEPENDNLDKELKDLGCYCMDGKVFLPLKSAYFTVMGRVAQLKDWAAENGYSYEISPAKFVQFGSWNYCEKTVTVFDSKGRVIGKSSGAASVGMGRTGVDATNPLENAETSALGRALTYLGVGSRMENVASAEEMLEAAKREAESEILTGSDDSQKENFIIDDLEYRGNGDNPLAKVQALNLESGEKIDVWLKDHMALQARNLQLKKGDAISAIISEIPGRNGPVKTFAEFALAS